MKIIVKQIKESIERHHGKLEKVGNGNSLFYVPAIDTFIYFRYGKVHRKSKPYAFFGLRKQDIDLARGGNFYVCFVTDVPDIVFSIPFSDFEDCYDYAGVSNDGQYKTHIFLKDEGAELYIPMSGKFAAEPYCGVAHILDKRGAMAAPKLDHAGAQTLIGVIGTLKGHRIWFPKNDLDKIDRNLINFSDLCRRLPSYGAETDAVFQEIDVIWVRDDKPVALFEVEHSTPIYSGLLRINDILISSARNIDAKIVAEQERRETFQRQVRRPTFTKHKLGEKVSFISYDNVWRWCETLKEAKNHEQ